MKQIAVKLTEQAIAGLGGLKRFVGSGDVVWVKPNIGWDRAPEKAANTNPDVVATLVRLCFEAGAKVVKVGDNTCNIAAKCYQASGIGPAVTALGAEGRVPWTAAASATSTIRGERVKKMPVYPEHHGVRPGDQRAGRETPRLCSSHAVHEELHGRDRESQRPAPGHSHLPGRSDAIHDRAFNKKPTLCVLDAVRILTAHGPGGGDLDDVQVKTTVAAGIDIVALDALGAELLGKKPAELATIVKGEKAGLGKMDYRSLACRSWPFHEQARPGLRNDAHAPSNAGAVSVAVSRPAGGGQLADHRSGPAAAETVLLPRSAVAPGHLAVGPRRAGRHALGAGVVVVTVLVGRVFCGWVCPLGTIHALAGWVFDRAWREQAAATTGRPGNGRSTTCWPAFGDGRLRRPLGHRLRSPRAALPQHGDRTAARHAVGRRRRLDRDLPEPIRAWAGCG